MIDVYTHMDASKIQLEHQTKLLNEFKGENQRISQILEQNMSGMKKFKDQQQSNEEIFQQQLESLIEKAKEEQQVILKNTQVELLNTIDNNKKESKLFIQQLQNKLDKLNSKYEESMQNQSLLINSNQTQFNSEIVNLQQQINEINKPFEITPQDRMKFTVQTQLISKFLKGELNKDYAEYFKNCFTHMLLRVEELQDLFKRLISELPPMYHRSRRNTTIQIGYRTKTQFNKLF